MLNTDVKLTQCRSDEYTGFREEQIPTLGHHIICHLLYISSATIRQTTGKLHQLC